MEDESTVSRCVFAVGSWALGLDMLLFLAGAGAYRTTQWFNTSRGAPMRSTRDIGKVRECLAFARLRRVCPCLRLAGPPETPDACAALGERTARPDALVRGEGWGEGECEDGVDVMFGLFVEITQHSWYWFRGFEVVQPHLPCN